MAQLPIPSTEWVVGTHHLRFEEPDILVATVREWITEAHAVEFIDISRQLASRHPVYWVVNQEATKEFPYPRLEPKARQYLARHSCSDWFKGIVHVGGGLLQHITIKGLTLALMLTGTRRFESEFKDSLEEARAWIEEHRAKSSSPGTP